MSLKILSKKIKDLSVKEVIEIFGANFKVIERKWHDITSECDFEPRLSGMTNETCHYDLQVSHGQDNLLFVWDFNTKKLEHFCTLAEPERYKFEIQKDGRFRILYLRTDEEE